MAECPVADCCGSPVRSAICSAPVLVGLLAIVPYSSLLFTGDLVLKDSIYSDYGSYQLPVREFVQSEFAAGRFPHWIPWLGCGIPLHATQQVGITYPFCTPLYALMPVNQAVKLSLFLHIVLAYVGQYRLARALGISREAAGLAGLIATQNGFVTGHLAAGHVALIQAFALLPWLLGSVIGLCRSPSRRGAARFAALTALLLLVGHPQVPYYAFLFGGIWCAASLIGGAASRHRSRCTGFFAMGLLVAVLLAGVQIVPTLELIHDNAGLSRRGDADYAGVYALEGADLSRMLMPSLFGNPFVGIPEFNSPDFHHEKTCYLGIITWLLAAMGMLIAKQPRWCWGTTGLTCLSIVIALGNSTPLFPILGDLTPGLFLFRCPGRCLALAAVFVALLAARGIDTACAAASVSRAAPLPVPGAIAVCSSAVLASWLIGDSFSQTRLSDWPQFAEQHLFRNLNVWAAAVVTSAVLVCSVHFGRFNATMAIAVVLAADLGYFNLREVQFDVRASTDLHTAPLRTGDLYRFVDAPQWPRIPTNEVRYSKLVPIAIANEWPMLGTNEGGVLPGSCERFFAALEQDPPSALHVAACRYVAERSNGINWTEIDDTPRRVRWLRISRVDDVHCDLPCLYALESTLRSVVSMSRVDLTCNGTQSLDFLVEADESGTLLVADTFYPGWQCTVDGKPATIRTAAGCFRAVPLPPGPHRIRMWYRPDSFWLGAGLSAIGVFAASAMGLSRTGNRSDRQAPQHSRFSATRCPAGQMAPI